MSSTPNRSRLARGVRSTIAVTLGMGMLAAACGGSDDTNETTTPDAVPAGAEVRGGSVSGPADSSPPVAGGRIPFGIEAEPGGLDATRYAFSNAGHMVASAVFDPLATLDADGNAVPYLASSIEPNDDNTTWTITLPDGVEFHDGTPLDAAAVVANLEAYRISSITGAALFAIEAVSETGPLEVIIELDRPYARFPLLLTTQLGYVMAPVMLDEPEYAAKPVGTGPFVFSRHDPDKVWSFTKNPSYWRDGLPYLDAIDFEIIQDASTRLERFTSGDLDMMYTERPGQIAVLRANEGIKRAEYSLGDETMSVLNTTKPPFDNLTARRAVAYATDAASWRAEIAVDGAGDLPSNGPFSAGQPGYLEDNGYPEFDMAKAKELVAQYEAETGQPLAFAFANQADVDTLRDANYFADLYTEAGMTVEITSVPQINLVATIATGNYQMGRFRLFNQPDPDADSHFWRSESIGELVSLNFPRHVNTDMDATIDAAMATEDPAERDRLYQEVNRTLAAEVPYVWLGQMVWLLAANPRVNGMYESANGSLQTVGVKTWIAELWLSR